MKRYIRTENGKIFDTEFVPAIFKWDWNVKFIIDDNNLIIYDKRSKDRIANHGQILKQSDNLEELIDEYILKDTETGYCGIMDKEVMKHSINPGTAYGREFYGAIWAIGDNDEPILKSVSKFNSEERLALL